MSKFEPGEDQRITPDMTVLDVIDRYRDTEAVFRKYDEQAGVCICCQALFDTIADVAAKYRLNLDQFLSDLEDAISP
jgi:hypothetical protein